jgi:hypothetical protein
MWPELVARERQIDAAGNIVNKPIRIGTVASSIASVLALASCASYQTTLTNDQGQTVPCEAHGWMGPVAAVAKHERYEDCIDKAKARGFKETQHPAPAPNPY